MLTKTAIKDLLNSYQALVQDPLKQQDLYNFYIYLALHRELTFGRTEPVHINAIFNNTYKDVKFANTAKAFYSYIGTLNSASAKYWKYVQDCAKEKNVDFLLYQETESREDTNEDNENDDHEDDTNEDSDHEEDTNEDNENRDNVVDIEDHGDSAGSDDDNSDYDDSESDKSSIVEFNSNEIKERFINISISKKL